MNFHPRWMLVIVGAGVLVCGLIWVFAPGVPLGRLPGDVRIESGSTRVHIPITTCIVISLVLSAILWLVRRLAG